MASPGSDGSVEVRLPALEDEEDDLLLAGGSPSAVPGIVPVGSLRKVRGRDGTEEEKISLKLRACISCRLVMTEQQVGIAGFRYACAASLSLASAALSWKARRRVLAVHAGVISLQFYEDGCPNCAWLQIDGDKSRVHSCTSANFSGFIAVAKAQGSWVARYNRLSECPAALKKSVARTGFEAGRREKCVSHVRRRGALCEMCENSLQPKASLAATQSLSSATSRTLSRTTCTGETLTPTKMERQNRPDDLRATRVPSTLKAAGKPLPRLPVCTAQTAEETALS